MPSTQNSWGRKLEKLSLDWPVLVGQGKIVNSICGGYMKVNSFFGIFTTHYSTKSTLGFEKTLPRNKPGALVKTSLFRNEL